MNNALADGPDEYRSVDVDFHLAVVRGAGNELATLVFEATRLSLEQTVPDTFLREADWSSVRERLTGEHRAVLAARGRETARRGSHQRFLACTAGRPQELT